MLIQTRPQIRKLGLSRGFSGDQRDINRRQCVLVQTERFSCEALDAIACDGGAEGARRDAQAQSREGLMIGQNG